MLHNPNCYTQMKYYWNYITVSIEATSKRADRCEMIIFKARLCNFNREPIRISLTTVYAISIYFGTGKKRDCQIFLERRE